MGLPLVEIVSECKKPLICGYVQQGILVYDNDSFRLCTHFFTDAIGNAHCDHQIILKIRPRLTPDVGVRWVAANESGSRVVLLGSRSAFFVEMPRDIWATDMKAWNERIQPAYYCRCAAIGSALQVGAHQTSILKARWYMKERGEVGQDKSNRIALLYSDSMIRIFDTSRCAEIPITKLDFRPVLSSDFSGSEAWQTRLGLYNSVVSFDFGPSIKYADATNEQKYMHTIFAVDSENSDLYVAHFQFDPPLSFEPSGPFHIEPQPRGECVVDVCDIINVRHTSNAAFSVFALITTGGAVAHFVPVLLRKAFIDGITDYEMVAIDSFFLSCEPGVSDELFLVNDTVESGRYLICGLGSVFCVDVRPSIATMLDTLKSDLVDKATTESENIILQHVFSVLGVDPSSAQQKITSACTVVTLVQKNETGDEETYARKVLFAAVTGEDELLTRCITAVPSMSANLSQECISSGGVSLSDQCVDILRNRVTIPQIKLTSSLTEQELMDAGGAVVDALLKNLLIGKSAYQLALLRLSDADQRKLDLEEQWEEIDARTLEVVRGCLDAKNQVYKIENSVEKIRKRLNRIHSVLSARAPVLTNAEKEILDKLEKMQSAVKKQTHYIARLADEVASKRRDRLGFMRPFNASFNARAFVLSKNSSDIANLENWIKQLKKRLDTFGETAVGDSHSNVI